MKKSILLLLTLISLSCKKESVTEYKVVGIERPGTFACKYTLKADGKDDQLVRIDECGKYKIGQVVLRVIN